MSLYTSGCHALGFISVAKTRDGPAGVSFPQLGTFLQRHSWPALLLAVFSLSFSLRLLSSSYSSGVIFYLISASFPGLRQSYSLLHTYLLRCPGPGPPANTKLRTVFTRTDGLLLP